MYRAINIFVPASITTIVLSFTHFANGTVYAEALAANVCQGIDSPAHFLKGIRAFKFKGGKRSDFENLLDDKLPELLTQKQKKDKKINNHLI